MSGSGNGCVDCDPCLSRLCVDKDGSGRVTALSYWENAETLVEVPACVSYDCVDGECVEVTGPGGAYATLEECREVCGGTVDACGCAGVPTTLYAHFTGALAGLGTVTLAHVAGASPSRWEGAAAGTCGSVAVTFTCFGGSAWVFNLRGDTSATSAGGPADACSPFSWSTTTGASGACSGLFTVTVNTNP